MYFWKHRALHRFDQSAINLLSFNIDAREGVKGTLQKLRTWRAITLKLLRTNMPSVGSKAASTDENPNKKFNIHK